MLPSVDPADPTPATAADPADPDRSRLVRAMPGASPAEVTAWLALPDRAWVLRHGPALAAAGLTAAGAADLRDRLPSTLGALALNRMLVAARMADLDCRHVPLWARAGIFALPTTATHPRNRREGDYVAWVTQARRYITAAGGDQHTAAWAAAAGLSVEETRDLHQRNELTIEALETLTALRDMA